MSAYQAYMGEFNDEQAVWLKAGRYEAALVPGVGGNMLAFRDTQTGYRFLREPAADEMDAFRTKPGAHGVPILFPPNRYEDGKFPWRGTTYQLPVNDPKGGNHIHGYVHTVPWTVEEFGAGAAESFVTVALKVDVGHIVHQHLPFKFTMKLKYTLSENGLAQHLFVKNDGQEEMPCLIAFHTAINAPFAPGSSAEDYLLKATIGQRWEMSERTLPTGRYLPLSREEEAMKNEGVNPYFQVLDNHYTVATQGGRNRMELTDKKEGVTLVYDVGTSYKQWMIWNNGACGKFFCPEPQINLVNAPNTDLPAEEIGLFGLAPGEIWEETARFYVK
ncbi:MAG: aldose 1-epimerase [Paenibacillaceae bacterium]|jgi:aldose 1-epimerase|nr:aldose 1-epimerase [Paenibacillaceae bacterium]